MFETLFENKLIYTRKVSQQKGVNFSCEKPIVRRLLLLYWCIFASKQGKK